METPALLQSELRPGDHRAPGLVLRWTAEGVEVQAELVHLHLRWKEAASLQVSRSRVARRRWWGGVAREHWLHAEVRAAQGTRVRLSARADDPAALEGLPWKEGVGPQVALDELLALLATARYADVPLASWSVGELVPPPDAARPARPPRPAKPPKPPKPAKASTDRTGILGAVGAGVFIVSIFGMIHTCAHVALRFGVDRIEEVMAIPGEPDQLLLVGRYRWDEQDATRLFLVDTARGQTLRDATWHPHLVATVRPAKVLGIAGGMLWLCGDGTDVEGWSVQTLEPQVMLGEQLAADKALIEEGFADAGWMNCEDKIKISENSIKFYSNRGAWREVYPLDALAPAAPRSCSGVLTGHARLPGEPQAWVRWEEEHLQVKGSDGATRRLKHKDHASGQILLDRLTCDAVQLDSPPSVILAWRDRLDRPVEQLSRVRLSGKRGEVWSARSPLPLERYEGANFATRRGDVLVLGALASDPRLVGLDAATGEVRWELGL